MKKIVLAIAIILCLSNYIIAQEANQKSNEIRTVFNNAAIKSNGGYGGLMANYTQLANRDAILMGAKGGWIINHAFTLGMGGYGFITEPEHDIKLGKDYEFTGGYGGLLLEPIIAGKQPVHISIPILIGAGGIAYTSSYANKNNQNNYYDESYEDSDAFFVIEPGLELEFNVVKFMRFALAFSYRYTSDVKLKYTSLTESPTIASKNLLNGWNFGVVFKFGKF